MSVNETVLIVDDNDTARMLVKYTVTPMGYVVEEAMDGHDGLSRLATMRGLGSYPVLIISDLDMPNLDGIEFVKQVRGDDKKTPIVCLTAQSSESAREAGRSAGVNAWVVKPFVPEKLRAIINKLMAKESVV